MIESILEVISNNSFIIFNGDIFDSIASEDIIGDKTIIYINGNCERKNEE